MENMELDEIRSATEQKWQWLVRVEPNPCCNLRNETFKIFEGTNLPGDRNGSPHGNLAPHEKGHTRLEAFPYSDLAVRAYACQCGVAVDDCHLAAKLLYRADSIKVRFAGKRPQVEYCTEPALCHRFPLSADKPQ